MEPHPILVQRIVEEVDNLWRNGFGDVGTDRLTEWPEWDICAGGVTFVGFLNDFDCNCSPVPGFLSGTGVACCKTSFRVHPR